MKSETLTKLEQQILQSLYTLHRGVSLVDENWKRTMGQEFKIVPDWLLDAWLPANVKRSFIDLNDTLKELEQLELIVLIKMEKWTWLSPVMCYRKDSREYVLVKPVFIKNRHGYKQKPTKNTWLSIVVGRPSGTGKLSKSRDEHFHHGPGKPGFDAYKLTKNGIVLVRESLIKPAKQHGHDGKAQAKKETSQRQPKKKRTHRKKPARDVATTEELNALYLRAMDKSYREIGVEQGVSYEAARQRCLRAEEINKKKSKSTDLSKAVQLLPDYSGDTLPAQRTKRQR